MLNAIPIIGWILSLLFSASLALPFWIIWTVNGVGAKYAYWLPNVYQTPGFWECVGIFMVASIIKTVFIPSLASVSNDNKAEK